MVTAWCQLVLHIDSYTEKCGTYNYRYKFMHDQLIYSSLYYNLYLLHN